MKSLIILTFSFLIIQILQSTHAEAQVPSAKVGIYDFTGNTASQFYVLTPVLMTEFKLWKSANLDLRISPGFSFNMTRYNSHFHYLYMVPLLVTIFYHLPNADSKIYPSIGMGNSLIWKADYNRDFEKTHYSAAYGFHATGRINYSLNRGRLVFFDMTYNQLVPNRSEEVNLSGVILLVGMDFSIKFNTR